MRTTIRSWRRAGASCSGALAALALLLAPTPARAQDFDLPLFAVDAEPLGADHAGMIVDLLGTWAELVGPEAPRVQDPLDWLRRHAPARQVIVPPGATYDRACSLMLGEAVFTLGAQPSPGEMAGELGRLMRLGAGQTQAATASPSSRPAVSDPSSAMAVMQQMLAGEGPLAAQVRQGMRDHQPVGDGPSAERVGRLAEWYAARGFGVNGDADDAASGLTLEWDDEAGTGDVVVRLLSLPWMPALRPACGHLARGPAVVLTLGGMDGMSTDAETFDGFPALVVTYPYATDQPDEPVVRRFRSALRRHGIEGTDFERLLVMVMEAEWLAGEPRILEALVAEARRDPTNRVAQGMLATAENVQWFRRHEAALRPALASWRAALGRR